MSQPLISRPSNEVLLMNETIVTAPLSPSRLNDTSSVDSEVFSVRLANSDAIPFSPILQLRSTIVLVM